MYLKDLENYKCPIIITQSIENIDKANAILSLYKVLDRLDKKVDILVTKRLKKDVSEIFKSEDIKVLTKIKPLIYEVLVDYGKTSIKSISYDTDDKNKLLKFIITPGDEGFDFSAVEFKDGGTKYDLTILFDIENPQELGDIYESNDYIFRENKVISIGNTHNTIYENKIKINDKTNYSSAVYNLISTSNIDIQKDILETLIGSTVSQIDILSDQVDVTTLEKLTDYAKQGYDVSTIFKNKYFSKSEENLNVQIKLMQNVRTNKEPKYIWGHIKFDDLKFYHVNESNLDISGRLPYNISSAYDIAFGVYEIEVNKYLVLVQSNNADRITASSIASVHGGEGNDNNATFYISTKSIDDVADILTNTLQEIEQLM